jgi:purine-nucleoside/S-methyl-5'-thioadenosine phosphorylase / adenosine deaminase
MNLPPHEIAPGFQDLGFVAFTTTRQAGSFNLASNEPAATVFGRWMSLVDSLRPEGHRLATALQVHGNRILRHGGAWAGWLRDTSGADGHMTSAHGTAMAVTVADCVPVFIAHPDGLGLLLHSGWKGTAAGILNSAFEVMDSLGQDVSEAQVHFGPAICGKCYEVGPEVYAAVTGDRVESPTFLDLRGVMAGQARQAGATVTVSESCTRCHNERFYSHRAGDEGRQLGVLMKRTPPSGRGAGPLP